jgi:hypothetical protein
MVQLLIGLAVVVAAIAVGLVLRRRQAVDVPTQPVYEAPTQLDRADFPSAGPQQWLVVVFSSATCTTCADVVRKAAVLESRHVAFVDAEYGRFGELHRKYHIDGVPIAVIADQAGVVRSSFVGPVSATDLWAALARARE